jgi:O-methyltransferase
MYLDMPFRISCLRYYNARKKKRQHKKIFCKYKNYTMIPEFIYLANLELAEQAYSLAGAVVECGTWRGGMIAGISL